jgi:hypothetical protein
MIDQEELLTEPVICLKGSVVAILRDADGNIKQTEEKHNMIVNVGKYWFAKKLAEESAAEMTHVAIGTGSTAAAAGDTTLAGSSLARVEATSKIRTDNVVVITADYPAGTGTGAVNEAAIFDGAAGTNMLARYVFGGVFNKGAADVLQILWSITIG